MNSKSLTFKSQTLGLVKPGSSSPPLSSSSTIAGQPYISSEPSSPSSNVDWWQHLSVRFSDWQTRPPEENPLQRRPPPSLLSSLLLLDRRTPPRNDAGSHLFRHHRTSKPSPVTASFVGSCATKQGVEMERREYSGDYLARGEGQEEFLEHNPPLFEGHGTPEQI